MPSSPDTDTPPEDRPDTATRILDCAQARIQRRGYNAVSYGDLAEELDLTTAAIHYHFPSKADLVQTLVRRYRRRNAETRATICEEADTLRARLDRYVALFADVIDGGGLCLCGVLAADGPTLPTEVRREVRQFFAEQEDWLTDVLEAGAPTRTGLSGCETPREEARLLLAAIEGAMITAPERSAGPYVDTLQRLVDSVVT
ncbi:MAG: TetR/AcrR family transcriptional regulator [Salinivenus sp.]